MTSVQQVAGYFRFVYFHLLYRLSSNALCIWLTFYLCIFTSALVDPECVLLSWSHHLKWKGCKFTLAPRIGFPSWHWLSVRGPGPAALLEAQVSLQEHSIGVEINDGVSLQIGCIFFPGCGVRGFGISRSVFISGNCWISTRWENSWKHHHGKDHLRRKKRLERARQMLHWEWEVPDTT